MKELHEAAKRLEAGLAAMQLDLPRDPFLNYLALLNKWNLAYSLTAIHSPVGQVDRYVLDSLAILSWLKGTHLLDVGSGAGVPGIALAIARPDLRLTLLDSNGKKTRFLTEVKRTLGLDNVTIVHARAEQYAPVLPFESILSCAFSELSQMIQWTEHLLAKDGIWLAMKGRIPDTELAALTYPFETHRYQVPFVEAERCCILIKKSE